MLKNSYKNNNKCRVGAVVNINVTPSNSEIICGQNDGTKVVCGMILFSIKKTMLKI